MKAGSSSVQGSTPPGGGGVKWKLMKQNKNEKKTKTTLLARNTNNIAPYIHILHTHMQIHIISYNIHKHIHYNFKKALAFSVVLAFLGDHLYDIQGY